MDNNALLAFLITFIILDALIFGFWIYTAYCYHRDCYDRSKIDLSDYHLSTIIKATPLIRNTIDKEQLINTPLHVYPPLPLPPNYTATEWRILHKLASAPTEYGVNPVFSLNDICRNLYVSQKTINRLIQIGKDIQSGKYFNPYHIPILKQTEDYRFYVARS